MPTETLFTISAVLAVFVFFASVTIFSDLHSKEH
jgi:hypothetical protein